MIALAAGYIAERVAPHLRWVAYALILATVFVAGGRMGAGHVQGKWDAEKAERTRQALEASEEARRIEQKRASGVQEAQDHAQAVARVSRADAAAARSELERVRDALAERDRIAQHPGAVCRVDAGTEERKLLRGCAQAITELAASADEERAHLIELQGWARAITQP